jgi:hypothetical protein
MSLISTLAKDLREDFYEVFKNNEKIFENMIKYINPSDLNVKK